MAYDLEAHVFVAESSNLQGLVVEAKTLNQLKVELLYCIAELLSYTSQPSNRAART